MNLIIDYFADINRQGGFLSLFYKLFLIVILAYLVYFITRFVVAKVIIKIAHKTSTNWDDMMFTPQFFKRMSLIAVPIALKMLLNTLFPSLLNGEYEIEFYGSGIFRGILILLDTWSVVAIVLFVMSILQGVENIYNSYPGSLDKPISVFVQVIKIIVFCSAVVIIISILIGKSPTSLLMGMSAFAAVLMLVFKDSILGFVAGIQLMSNKMLKIGDWITMDSAKADGDVVEINLTTVKVQNFDKTITTIPTYKLVSEAFTNWRGMYEAKNRRIKRSINIDINSVHYLTDEEINTLKQSVLLKNYIENKLHELDKINCDRENILDKIKLTNIGTFREYIESWINENKSINSNLTFMVRQLQPTPTGLPLEVYCFANTIEWKKYEKIQADIFDHIFAVIPLFNLKIYQYTYAAN